MDQPRTDAGAADPVADPELTPAAAYIVSGAVSSGNRLLAAILVRSGCAGEASTNQPMRADQLPLPTQPLVIIKHGGLTGWIRALRAKGYERIVVILPIREPIANADSMVRRGHHPDFEDAYAHRIVVIAKNITEALAQRVDLEIVTYEGLTEPFLERWLPRIGLPYIAGPLSLPGQAVPKTIVNQNARHYQ
ncbi:MAG: hypothetical protein KatS3mg105_4979 [Gemmatales bacterium]|nr:MAG: hypothetical protein KatS3mg105_4979 [Gemmatales bacterium]